MIGHRSWSQILFAATSYARMLIWWDKSSVNIPTITCLHAWPIEIQVITFDERGVSDHPNHIATYRGVQQLFRELRESEIKIVGLKLQSTNVIRKFLGFFDVIFSIFTSDQMLLNYNLFQVLRGMAAHKSQNVWYRVLFVLFSRYSYVNTFASISWAYQLTFIYFGVNWIGILLGHIFVNVWSISPQTGNIARSLRVIIGYNTHGS